MPAEPKPAPDGGDLPDLEVPAAPPPPGDETLAEMLGTRYRVAARLGAGAFGEVYRARDTVLGRDVAVKTIRIERFVDPSQLAEVKQRFLREAQVASQLRHPNIVTTHDIVANPATSFIVMELVAGETLQARLAERGRLPLDETLRLIGQAAAALDHAHGAGVVHRDVKPANIMVEPGGHVKVMDFGIAKVDTGTNLTSTGLILGTPNYMSPEQAQGGRVDGRSDLFSLGCVLYECLAGRKPFSGESVTAILVKILTEDPPPIDHESTGLPVRVDAVLRRAIAKDPARRFATGAEMVAALRLAGETTVAQPTTDLAPALPATVEEEPPALPATAAGAGAGAGAPAARTPAGRTGRRRGARLAIGLGVLVIALAAAGVALAPAFSKPERRLAGEGGGLVYEERPGGLDRLFGRPGRLVITVPPGSRLKLTLGGALSSATARTGDEVVAELAAPVVVEGVEAAATGSRLSGTVVDAAPAGEAEGRGRLSIRFDSLEIAGEARPVETRPLVMRAPPSKKKDNGIIAGLAGVGAAVGGLLGGRGGAVAGTVLGGAAGVAVVQTDHGREVTLAGGAPVTVELTAPATVERAQAP